MSLVGSILMALQVPEPRRYVWKDRVSCPIQGDVSVELCFACRELRGLDLDAREPWIRCRPEVVPGEEFRPNLFPGRWL